MSTTSTPSSPPAGWYPAPDGSAQPWWWDGTRWSVYGPTPGPHSLGTRGLARLATATQALLVACGIVTIATIGVEMFGIVAASSFLDGHQAAFGLLNAYDILSPLATILGSLALISTGVVWAVWQFHAAKHVAGRTRRTPGWHAGSWFIPVVSLWFPYQNISDLWRAAGRSRPAWLIVWWLLWIANSVTSRIASGIYTAAESLELLVVSMWVSIAGALLLLAATPLAWLIVRGITAGIAHPRVFPTSPGV